MLLTYGTIIFLLGNRIRKISFAVFPHTVLLVESGTVDKDTMFTNAQSELVKFSTVCSNVISWSEYTGH